MSQFQLFDSVFCNITFIRNVWNSKMSQFGQRGGSAFFINVWNSKMSQRSKGGGVNPNWDIVPNFLDFLFWRLPLQLPFSKIKFCFVDISAPLKQTEMVLYSKYAHRSLFSKEKKVCNFVIWLQKYLAKRKVVIFFGTPCSSIKMCSSFSEAVLVK